jgi:hypothetical protein
MPFCPEVTMPGYARVKVSHRTIDWDRDTMPGFVDFEIRIEREHVNDKPIVANHFDCWARCTPVMFNPYSPGHWACRHNPGRSGFYSWQGTRPGSPTVWLKDGKLPESGIEQVQGGNRLGATWQVSAPPGLAGGSDAWGWVRMTVNVIPRWPKGNLANIDWSKPDAWMPMENIPCEGLAAIVAHADSPSGLSLLAASKLGRRDQPHCSCRP